MNFPIVREYQDDLLNNNLDNEKRGEPFTVVPGVWSRVIVPRHSPFFVESLQLYFPNGEPMVKDVHYRMFKLMSGLTALTAQKVGCMIELLDNDITDGFIDYDIAGEFSLFDTTLLNLINNTANDDRPVYWDNLKNRLVVFPPKLHGHSVLNDIVAWKDLIEVLDLMVGACAKAGKPLIQLKIEHYFSVYNDYLKLYGDMLVKYLTDHKNAYDSHGLTQVQVNLPLVDNFKTAAGSQALENRDDLHLTVPGLKTILDEFGFNTNDYMKDGSLPIATFGNTNFIPPSISGSFEGLGGQTEAAGICMESDGSTVFLENRYDGRVEGLYYSVTDNIGAYVPRNYSAFRYTHQRIEADNARVNRIAGGSGSEVILMADSRKEIFYIGLTNGSLDPAKHVLSRLNLDAMKPIFPLGVLLSDFIGEMNVFLTTNWIYVNIATPYLNRSAAEANGNGRADMRFRYFFRVPRASVAAQVPVTAAQINLSYRDGDGKQWNNVPYWRWCTPVGNYPNFSKYYFDFKQKTDVQCVGAYRSQITLACEVPGKPGKYVLKFLAAWWSRYITGLITGAWETMLEMTYEFDSETGVMTLLHQAPTFQIDYLNPPPINGNLYAPVYAYDKQSAVILDNGTMVSSYSAYQGFPRWYTSLRHRNLKTRYDMISANYTTQLGFNSGAEVAIVGENILSPIASGVKTRAFMLSNGGDFYNAAYGDPGSRSKVFYREAPGKLAVRSNINNLAISNIRARPLSNKVWEVRSDPRIGGSYVTVPAAQLDTFAIDVGLATFCCGVQKKHFPLTGQSPNWPIPTEAEGIGLISSHTTVIAADGKMDIVPTGTITYPAAIVNLLKREVENVAAMLASPEVFVTVSDPTGALTTRFGWLPVLVHVTYAEPGTTNRRQTFMHITPTYSGGVNKTVTGFTVVDKIHATWERYASALTPTTWDARVSGLDNATSHGPPRCGYHVNGNDIRGFFDTGIQASGTGDGLQAFADFRFPNKTTKRWSRSSAETYLSITGNTGSGNHRAVVPDEGVVVAIPHSDSAGGAATIFRGANYNAMLGHVYPEIGWVIFFQQPIKVVFNGKSYTLPNGTIDLRDVEASPANKTFYIYAVLKDGTPIYEVAQEKRLESPWQLWVGTVVTNNVQILTIERFNVFTVNGQRISELKRGSSIPASSGLTNNEGQIPWLTAGELLP